MDVSVLICTRNRASHLRETLRSLAQVTIPAGMACELLIVDNCSSDETAQVALEGAPKGMDARVVREPKPGVSNARNTSVREARGDFLLCTDDDVRFPSNWLDAMTAPLRGGSSHAVAGVVKIAPHLERPWMTPLHRRFLAAAETLYELGTMTFANAAWNRRTWPQVAGWSESEGPFDPALGPGKLGAGEETLYSFQLLAGGFPITPVMDAPVEHHFDASRLKRASFLSGAEKRGRVKAYLDYHWWHYSPRLPRTRLAMYRALWATHRATHPRDFAHTEAKEGCSEREFVLRRNIGYFAQLLEEQKTPRLYARQGTTRQQPQTRSH